MKVILTEYVYKHGVAGDVVNVADGFARNYLIPRGLAVRATPGTIRNNQRLIEQATKNRAYLRQMESEAAAQIHDVELVFGVKAGKNNKLYGSVTTRDIADALLEKTGVDINRRRISERALRELGMHEVPVRMSGEVSPILRVVIVREEEVVPYRNGEMVPSLIALGLQKNVDVAYAAETAAEETVDAEAAVAEAVDTVAEVVDEIPAAEIAEDAEDVESEANAAE